MSWDGCSSNHTSTLVTDVVIYGLTRMPANITVSVTGNGTTIEPSENPEDQAFYDSNVMRLQVSDLVLDWCDELEREIRWTFFS